MKLWLPGMSMRVSRRDTIDRYYLFSSRNFGVFLHRIKRSDPRGVMHTHPWSWVSLIFGSYVEERALEGAGRRRRFFNRCAAGVPHRVTIEKPVWTLLIHGRRRCFWEVMDDAGNTLEVEPWTGTERPERRSYL